MDRSTTADPQPTAVAEAPRRVLCAYSPRWLSGPAPRYRGLCATWEGDELTTEQAAIRAN